MLNTIADIIGTVLLVLGVIVFLFQIIGVTKYKYLLNRMHAAGMGDTLGAFLCMLGLIFINGLNLTSLKFVLIIFFLWFSSPTSSHLISRLEVATDEEIHKFADVQIDEEEMP